MRNFYSKKNVSVYDLNGGAINGISMFKYVYTTGGGVRYAM